MNEARPQPPSVRAGGYPGPAGEAPSAGAAGSAGEAGSPGAARYGWASRVEAPAKLTRSLRVVGRRTDGYHDLAAEMVSVDLADTLTIEWQANGEIEVGFEAHPPCSGDDLSPLCDDPGNSVRRALGMLGLGARVKVTKRIPPGGGLGGGSSDAGAVLYAGGWLDVAASAKLGADVPFCLSGGRARVTGLGEIVEPLQYVEERFTLLLPGFGIDTPSVYEQWDAMGSPEGAFGNDLEPAAIAVEPRLLQWREWLGAASGMTPVLAGSGSTWYVEGWFDIEALQTLPDGMPGCHGMARGEQISSGTAVSGTADSGTAGCGRGESGPWIGHGLGMVRLPGSPDVAWLVRVKAVPPRS